MLYKLKSFYSEKAVLREPGLKDVVFYYSIKTCAEDFGK